MIMSVESLQKGLHFSGPEPKVVKNEGPSAYWVSDAHGRQDPPLAHLLGVSGTTHVMAADRDGGEYIGFDWMTAFRAET